MANKITIKNVDVLRFLLREFNNNSFSEKISFSVAQWMATKGEDGLDSLLIQKLALNNNQGLDVVATFDDETYTFGSKAFIPMNIAVFNGEPTALPQDELKEVVFDTSIDFLVYLDDVRIQEVINMAIDEVRSNLIQKFTTFEISNINYDEKDKATRIVETLKVVVMTGSLEYGVLTEINGKNYMTYHLNITALFTDKGEFANQQKFKLGVESIVNETTGKVIMEDIFPLSWHWGRTTAHESTQLLNEFPISENDNASEVVSTPINVAYGFACDIYMDFKNPILRKLYIDSKNNNKGNGKELFYLYDETAEYDEKQKKWVVADDMKFTRALHIGLNQPKEELSKGEKIVWTLSFTPAYIENEEE